MLRIFLLLLLWQSIALCNVLYLDKNHITITPNFTGDNINLYGIKPQTGSVIVVLKGEKETYYIQKKEKKMGIWVKGEKKKLNNTYRYYNIFSEKSLNSLNIAHLLKPFEIGIENINTYNTTVLETLDFFEYKNALFNYKITNNLYHSQHNCTITTPENLLYLQMHIPRTIPAGNYIITVYIVENGQVKTIINMPLYVSYSKLLNFVTNAVKNQKLLYLFLNLASSIGLALIAYVLLGKKYIIFFTRIGQFFAKTFKNKQKTTFRANSLNNSLNNAKSVQVPAIQVPAKRPRGRPRKIQALP